LSEEDVLGLDVAVVDTLGMDKLDGTHKLHHEVAHVLSLKRALAVANGFVEVTIGAELKNEVDVVLGLKRLEQVDNIGVVTKTQMDTKLFGALINGKSGGAVDGGRALGDDLDGNMVTRYQVLGLEDHAKGAIVKRRDCFIPSIEYNACVKVIAHTLHEG
jgi:hypothetical protein